MVAQHTAKQIVPTKEDKKSNIKSGLSKGQWNGENRIAKGNVKASFSGESGAFFRGFCWKVVNLLK